MSGYSNGGASLIKKALKAWLPLHFSAKEDVDQNLATLRSRAADLAINSALGQAAINVQSTNVIGIGLKVFPRIKYRELNLSPDDARTWARKTKQEFELWAASLDCDFQRRNNFYELQNVAYSSYLVDGDSFCLFKRRPPTFENPYTLRLHLIDAQRVSNPLTGNTPGTNVEMQLPNRHRIINGIEVDGDGQLLAIYVCNRIFNEPTTTNGELKWQRVEMFGRETGCRNVLHICHDVRPDQFRGIPYLASVIEPLKQISRYSEAELTSAIIKSCFSIFFIQPLGTNFDLNQILGEKDDPKAPVVDVNEFKLGSGTFSALPRGVDVKAIDSSNTQSTFDSFINAFASQIGAALGIPYELLMKKFQSSYSASRAALLQAADEFRQRKTWFINDFCQPIYEQFLTEAVAIGRIKADGFFDDPLKRAAWLNAEWYTPTSRILDPVKEVNAAILRLNNGLSTYGKELSEMSGLDFDEAIETLAQERQLMAKTLAGDENET